MQSRQMKYSRRAVRSAFTLIELLLVLAILAILATVVAVKVVGRTEQAKITKAMTEIDNIGTALNAYEVDNGHYPTSEEGLGSLLNPPANAKGWKKPYIDKMGNDPWGQPYIYRCPGQVNGSGFDLVSYGPDMREGTEDDITNFSTVAK